jgi:hypothetical protein
MTENTQHRSLVVFMVGVMLLHAITYPVAIVERVRSQPKDKAVNPIELQNLHYIADYFGTIVSGVAIAFGIIEKVKESMDEAADEKAKHMQGLLNLAAVDSTIDCSKLQDWETHRKGVKQAITVALAQDLAESPATEVVKGIPREICVRFIPRTLCPDGDVFFAISEEHEEEEDAPAPAEDCANAHMILARLRLAILQDHVILTKIPVIGDNFVVMTLVALSYYAAVYNIIDMSNAMTAQDDLVKNNWSMMSIFLLVFLVYILWFTLNKYTSSTKMDKGHECKDDPCPQYYRCAYSQEGRTYCHPSHYITQAKKHEVGTGYWPKM